MKLRDAFILGITTAVLLGFLSLSCAKDLPLSLRVGTNLWLGYDNLYLARDLGFYKNHPIRLVNYPSQTEQMRAYRNRELELATITIADALQLSTTDPGLRIILVMDHSNGGDAVVGKPEIQNLQGLRNRRVGVEPSALEAYMLARALEKVGMTAKDVKVVPLGLSEQEQAYKQGVVEAVVTYEPVRSKLLALGANLLFDSRQIPGEIVDVLVTSETLLTSQSQSLEVLLKGWFKALDYSEQNPLEAARQLAAREGLTPEQFLEALKGIKIPDLQENQKLLSKTDITLLNASKRLSVAMLEKQLLSRAVDPTPLLDDRLVKNLKY